ncbi:sigma-70 family RNA polymerase sigma factor [Burkholderia sp. Ac-20345]|nr:sigma-70 family RNA polymerase sigma factor [Burkholderia sp. Ac-20345]MBN3782144.1 sigma-70 family RNA polymerase sigma factor [Burkholderia sp. Ac-20345]
MTQTAPRPHGSRPDEEDRALLVRIVQRDRVALTHLYRNYHRRLVRFLGRFTRSEATIEEIVNDSFMIVWQKASEFRGESRVSTWLMGIAYRVTLKALRQGGLSHEPLPDGDEGAAVEPFTDYETADWLAKGLGKLTPEQRLVMELAYVMGHSLEEIADITLVPVSSVKSRMFHARVKLRNLMPELATPKRINNGSFGP